MSEKKLRATRNGHKSHVRRTINNVKESIKSELNQELKAKLQAYRKTLSEKRDLLGTVNEQILELMDVEADIETEVDESSALDTDIDEWVAQINEILKEPSQAVEEVNTTSGTKKQVRAKLPKLALNKFTGNPIEWAPFWDSFQSAVDSNTELSEVDKFNYLKSLLQGAAAETIAGFSLTKVNYQEAVKLLGERYGNKQVVISAHVDSILKLPAASTLAEVEKIRNIYDKLESHVRSLEAIGIESSMYGSFLTPVIMTKIPEELRVVICRNLKSEQWDLTLLLKVFREELQIREKCSYINATSIQTQRVNKVYSPLERKYSTNKQPHTASALLTGNTNSSQGGPWCTYCKGQHPSTKCTVVTNIDARKQIIREKRKCFRCLRSNHLARECNAKPCYRCGQQHHPSICKHESTQNNTQGTGVMMNSSESSGVITTNLLTNSKNGVLLQTASANISRADQEDNTRNVRVIFDSCSQKTYISEKMQEILQLPVIGSDMLLIKTFGETAAKLRKCNIVQFAIHTLDGLRIYVTGYVVPTICSPISNQIVEFAQSAYHHLQGLQLADRTTATELNIDVLIGADFYWHFMDGTVVRGDLQGPVALSTKLGYVLSGPVGFSTSQGVSTVNLSETHVLKVQTQVVEQERCLSEQVKQFWDLETLGIKDNEPSMYDKFVEDIKFKEERYEVRLPFKETHPQLPDNYLLSVARLESQLKRLKSKPEILEQYNNIIQEQLRDNIVEIVGKEDQAEAGKVHYLPHKEVIRPEKETTKLRIVYDASAKKRGPSLNECLYAGPSLLPLIFDILVRFRVNKVGVVADIEKAFLNVAVSKEDREYLRFLWVDDIHKEEPQICIFRFTRVVFGLTSSPFLLNATIRYHLNLYEEIDPEFVREVLRSIYVDDLALSKPNETLALKLYNKLKERFNQGSFNMRKWHSNSKSLMDQINQAEESHRQKSKCEEKSSVEQDDQTYSETQFSGGDTDEETPKVLGVKWNIFSDNFILSFENILSQEEEECITKRSVLSTIARLYDPLGLLSPIVTSLKIMFQTICKEKLEWDDLIPKEIVKSWKEMIADMKVTSTIPLQRCYLYGLKSQGEPTYELHGFGDASEQAYGGVVYLRIVTQESVVCKLIASKTRVAPISKETIPRLELLSALVTAKLMDSVREALRGMIQISQIFCWLDSEIALWWITQTSKEYKQFVQNRVVQIRRLVSHDVWRHVPGEQNPADIASRGVKPSELKMSELWWTGPEFLNHDISRWPVNEKFKSKEFEGEPFCELKKGLNTVSVNIASQDTKQSSLESIINPSKYSDLYRLFHVTCYVLRFIRNSRSQQNIQFQSMQIETEELNTAESLWIKHCQKYVREESKFKQIRVSLGLYEDDNGIIRCKGRIVNAQIPYEARFPIILPRRHHITNLIIRKSHENVMHNGVKDTLNELRSKYWVVKGRQAVKTVISKCVTCKRIEGLSYNTPVQPPLPEFRMREGLAFGQVGVDFAGPLYVKDVYSQDMKMHKAYIALFTCATSRAVHLELTPDLQTESFIRSLKRFIGRRGVPGFVISDNAKTFKSVQLRRYVAQEGIVWKFNVPRAPWWGDFFERLVRCVKRCLKKTLGNSRLSFEEMSTVLIEVESVLNSRPLTYVYEELSAPLTPSELVIGRRLLNNPDHPEGVKLKETVKDISRRAKYLKNTLTQFWNRWRKEYVTELREHQTGKKISTLRRIAKGDVVYMYEDNTPRLEWKLGKVEELIKGQDDEVRAAVVRVVSGGRATRLKRPIQKLYPLEITEEEEAVDENPTITFVDDDEIELVKDNK